MYKTAFPDELFPSIFPVEAIQVRKFVSISSFGHSVAFLGLVARHLMRREKTWRQVLLLRSFAKQTEMEVLAISSAVCGFHVYKDIWKPSIGDKLACERELGNCFDKIAIKVVNNGETVGHSYNASS